MCLRERDRERCLDGWINRQMVCARLFERVIGREEVKKNERVTEGGPTARAVSRLNGCLCTTVLPSPILCRQNERNRRRKCAVGRET